jgi:N-acetyl-anhydromuramyl-L-alanine amidase AmpD
LLSDFEKGSQQQCTALFNNKKMQQVNSNINLIVVHCSATPNGISFSAADIHQMHVDRGFSGIGYHKVIRTDGTIENGRPEYWFGAHVEGHNKKSLGVCLIGTDKFSDKQFDSLATLLADYKKIFGSKLQITGHRDLSPDKDKDGIIEPHEWVKLCPGFDVKSFIKKRGL